MQIILASQSPRRKELLARLVENFEILPADVDESIATGDVPAEYVMKMAQAKGAKIAANHQDALVIACDTIVEQEGKILGKPQNKQEAFEMLTSLSGSAHQVHTAVFMQQNQQIRQALVSATVEFFGLTNLEIEDYLASGEYKDKAGAYGIQGGGGIFVKKIIGDYYAIVGLPIGVVHQMLKEFH